MIVDREINIDAPADEVYSRVVDIPFVGACLPGAQDVVAVPQKPDTYRGLFRIEVGPVAVGLQGTVTVTESDPEARRAVLMLRGSDRRVGGEVVGEMRLGVQADGARSLLAVHTEVTVSGKLGQFGQAVMIKKADQITEKFVAEFSRKLVAKEDVTAAPSAAAEPTTPAAAGPARPALVPGASPAPTAPQRAGDPYVVTALLGGRRRLWLDRAGATTAAVTGPRWQDGTTASGPAGAPRVLELTVADEAELKTALDALPKPASSVVALSPRGSAVGDSEALAALIRTALSAGRAAIPVARVPWHALAVARTAAAEGAPGAALVFDIAADADALLQLAIAEIRAAGLHLPIVAGVVPDGRAAQDLLAAGADGVLVTRGLRTRAAAVLTRFGRRI